MIFPDIAFIVNPHAGNGSTGSKWPEIQEIARRHLGRFDTRVTRTAGEARRFCRDRSTEGIGLIVGVGGDGTLNEMINGLMETGDAAKTVLGFIPNGTGCDIVKTLRIPRDIESAVKLIGAGEPRLIDIGKLGFRDHAGGWNVRFFHNVTSFGVGGEVVARVNRTSKKCGPFLSFLFATLISILRYGKKKIRLEVDAEEKIDCDIWNVAAANGRYHGGGMLIAPDASTDDGMLNVTLIGDLSLPQILFNLPKLYNGNIYNVPKVKRYRCRRLLAQSQQRVLLDVDGEQPGRLPLSVEIMPRALRIVKPA